ncbi:hypothetical protein CIG75_12810 [Tumebacillus algifaecis]|uniref:PBSX phage terminase small subunit-like N-terminal domain-containing protein n=1 Tax=Tumebacillus algifaecis TaxID=1214604 RepID=A0A223D2G4_9BACL|nr:DUF1804 family protein [Tumebacillus algifaecis]ASS75780.1 hypothetical protein CIG75_12810 [Tumebacillus algifaecis]
MAKARSPKRDQAKHMFIDSNGQMMLKDIAATLEVSPDQIRKWKRDDKKAGDDWEALLNGHVTNGNSHVTNEQKPTKRGGAPPGNQNAIGYGAPRGNKNAVGNAGGGAPPGNKNSLKHGRFETITWDALDEDERLLLEQISTDPLDQYQLQIADLNIRKRRMMLRILDLKNGLTEKGRRVLQQRQKVKEVVEIYDEKTGMARSVPVENHTLVVVEIEETETRNIDDIIKWEAELTSLEKALTRAVRDMAAYLSDAERLAMAREKLELEKFKAAPKGTGGSPVAELTDEELEAELQRLEAMESGGEDA